VFCNNYNIFVKFTIYLKYFFTYDTFVVETKFRGTKGDFFVRKVTFFGSLLVAGTLSVTALSGTAQADEEEGAKTVWGEVLPPETDSDGDGWANTGFDASWMTQESQDKIAELAYEKDFGNLSQVEFNEAVAALFQEEQQMQSEEVNTESNAQVDVEDAGINITEENLAKLALYSPETLDSAPLHDEPYDYEFIYDDYFFQFTYDGKDWEWAYESLEGPLGEELVYLVHNDPEQLNEKPVSEGAYDFELTDDKYVYHFASDGKDWTWSYEEIK
jgi:hypothetical protein